MSFKLFNGNVTVEGARTTGASIIKQNHETNPTHFKSGDYPDNWSPMPSKDLADPYILSAQQVNEEIKITCIVATDKPLGVEAYFNGDDFTDVHVVVRCNCKSVGFSEVFINVTIPNLNQIPVTINTAKVYLYSEDPKTSRGTVTTVVPCTLVQEKMKLEHKM